MSLKTFFAAGAVMASLTCAAGAVDFSTKFTQIDGTPFLDANGKPDEKPATLGTVAVNALLANYPDEQNLPADEKVKRFVLAEKIQVHPTDALINVDDIALIKKLIAKGYPTLVVGQAWRLLDPASVPK